MTAFAPERRWRGLLLPALVTLCALGILISLGVWQLNRKVWKESLIANIQQRIAAPPSDVPAQNMWSGLGAADNEFRRVTLRGELLHDRQAFVFAAPSALRDDVSGSGTFVFTPARLADGSIVMVNRGFLPDSRRAEKLNEPNGPTDLMGAMRWPEDRGLFTPADDPDRNLWFLRDHHAIAAAKGIDGKATAPFYIELEAPAPPSGFPKPAAIKAALRNNHLGYALTWFGLAAALVAVFAIWASGRLQLREKGSVRPSL